MPVLFSRQSKKLPGNPRTAIGFVMQHFVDALLSHKLIHPVIGIIITDQECFFDIMRDGRQTGLRTTVFMFRGLPGITAVDQQGTVFINSFFTQHIQFFERQQGERQLHRGSRIEINAGIRVEIIISKGRNIVPVPVDLCIDNLHAEAVLILQDVFY